MYFIHNDNLCIQDHILGHGKLNSNIEDSLTLYEKWWQRSNWQIESKFSSCQKEIEDPALKISPIQFYRSYSTFINSLDKI